MPLLARRVKIARAWAEIRRALPDATDIPIEVISDLIESKGEASFWVVKETKGEEIDRLLAALQTETRVTEITLAFVEESALTNLGVEIKSSTGHSADTDINNNHHRDVIIKTGASAMIAAKAIAVIPTESYPVEYILKCLGNEILRG